MQLSRASQFAVRMLLDLAVEGAAHTADLAARRGVPPAQAGKIIQELVRGGIARTARGAGGGVRLARPPKTITLRDVIEAVEGPITIARCLIWDDCPCGQPCPVRSALNRVQSKVEGLLQEVTIADLSADTRPRTGRMATGVPSTSTR